MALPGHQRTTLTVNKPYPYSQSFQSAFEHPLLHISRKSRITRHPQELSSKVGIKTNQLKKKQREKKRLCKENETLKATTTKTIMNVLKIIR